MRTFLRGLATIQVVTAVAVFLSTIGLNVYWSVTHNHGWFGLDDGTVDALIGTSLVAAAGGILWCHTALALPHRPPPVTPPKRQPMQRILQVLSLTHVGGGVALAVAAGAAGFGRLQTPVMRRNSDPFDVMLVMYSAIGLSCLGGLLWCAVRVAYPEPPRDAK